MENKVIIFLTTTDPQPAVVATTPSGRRSPCEGKIAIPSNCPSMLKEGETCNIE